MNVLGVHIGHDSSAAIVVDGIIVADAAEERFSRIKHDAGLPVQAIASCLDAAGLQMRDIDAVALPTEAELWPLNELLDLYAGPHEQGRSLERAAELAQRVAGGGFRPPGRRPTYAHRFQLAPDTELVKVAHHLAHAAAAYYTSGSQEQQLIVTLDGIGDGLSGAIWRGERGRIEPLEQFGANGSLGFFYSNVTEALGWPQGDGEGTTMALAAYGEPDGARGSLERFHPRFEGGALLAPHQFDRVHAWNERGSYQWHSAEAPTIASLIPRFGRENLAAEAQRVLEEQVCELVYPWLQREGTRTLSCSGGVFLNVKVNQRIWMSGMVDHHHIYPNPGDAGLAAGAALYAHYQRHPDAAIGSLQDVYLGPQYSAAEIVRLLEERRLEFTERDDVPEFAAQMLVRNQMIGWFQGRMESGPRALGSRSILVNPTQADNKDQLNAQVKFRQAFRPFGPSVLHERSADYLRHARPERFMITSFDVAAGKEGSIPAVVHVDGTVRPHTIERETNPQYWDLIAAFGKLTGEHAVLNTSFNLRGEPIVCHPRDAIRTFYDSGLDCLILGDHVLTKTANGRKWR